MPDEVVQTPFGAFLIPKGDLIGETLRAGTCWDGPGFLQPIAVEHGRLGEAGVTILDVGANLGAWSVWLAGKRAWRVLAVEPVPETLRYLKANLDLNRDGRVEPRSGWVHGCAERVIPIETAAYSQEWCRMDLATPLDLGNLGGTALVPTKKAGHIQACPLDDYQYLFGDSVSLIKIDAQGCDFAVLLGLARTIERYKPVIVFEWEADLAARHGHTLPQALAWLVECGYETSEWPCQPNNYLARPRR